MLGLNIYRYLFISANYSLCRHTYFKRKFHLSIRFLIIFSIKIVNTLLFSRYLTYPVFLANIIIAKWRKNYSYYGQYWLIMKRLKLYKFTVVGRVRYFLYESAYLKSSWFPSNYERLLKPITSLSRQYYMYTLSSYLINDLTLWFDGYTGSFVLH